MLGMKIAATGALVMLVSRLAVSAVGDWPGVAKGLPLLALWFGGVAAVIVGFLMAMWA